MTWHFSDMSCHLVTCHGTLADVTNKSFNTFLGNIQYFHARFRTYFTNGHILLGEVANIFRGVVSDIAQLKWFHSLWT